MDSATSPALASEGPPMAQLVLPPYPNPPTHTSGGCSVLCTSLIGRVADGESACLPCTAGCIIERTHIRRCSALPCLSERGSLNKATSPSRLEITAALP
jgi:hypothetical protein